MAAVELLELRGFAVPPQQQAMSGDQEAVTENAVTLCLGRGYEVCCSCCAACNCTLNLATIPQGAVGVVTQFGKYARTLAPGRHHFNIMAESVIEVNLKTVCLDIAPQEVMTKDNLIVFIDAVCYYKVADAMKATFYVENYTFALAKLAQVTLRTVLGEHTLADVFGDRMRINQRLQELIDEGSEPWGIQVERVELKEVKMHETMQRAMAAKIEAKQEAEAKLIQARAQLGAATILSEAAEKMASQPAAIQLQWFETLRIISTQGKNTTIIVPDQVDVKMA
jgi:regulator of protease activity HflC (stomatin/prohibitin superfamily)